jgi:hypothetical protein
MKIPDADPTTKGLMFHRPVAGKSHEEDDALLGRLFNEVGDAKFLLRARMGLEKEPLTSAGLGVLDVDFKPGYPLGRLAGYSTLTITPMAGNNEILLGCFDLAYCTPESNKHRPQRGEGINLFGTPFEVRAWGVGYVALDRRTLAEAIPGYPDNLSYEGAVTAFGHAPSSGELVDFALETTGASNLLDSIARPDRMSVV